MSLVKVSFQATASKIHSILVKITNGEEKGGQKLNVVEGFVTFSYLGAANFISLQSLSSRLFLLDRLSSSDKHQGVNNCHIKIGEYSNTSVDLFV